MVKNATPFPPPDLALANPNGTPAIAWYDLLLKLFERTGGAIPPSDVGDLLERLIAVQEQADFQSTEMPPAALQDALRSIADLWAAQTIAPHLSSVLNRLDDLESAQQYVTNLSMIVRRLDEIEALLLQPGAVQRDPSAVNPAMNGSASPGTSQFYARGDHVHPTDTSLAALAGASFTGTVWAPKFQTAVSAISGSASGTAKTIYVIPNGAPAAFLVSANIGTTNDTGNYNAFAVVLSDGSSARLAVSNNASLQTITLSGLNVQSTQNSGATQTINAVITRIG